MITAAQRQTHLRWLKALTIIPTAAGRERRVINWVRAWVKVRRNLQLQIDRAGNLIITVKRRAPRASRTAQPKPIFITAHLDHPAFVVLGTANDDTVELEFRGGVHDPYFQDAPIEIIDADDRSHPAAILTLEAQAKPFKRVIAHLHKPASSIRPGDIGRWKFKDKLPRITNGLLHTHACDDLAAVAAALSALDVLHLRRDAAHVGVLLTRAEEIGFIGAIAACKLRSTPKSARLICLENSRSFAESPIGGGPIVRVGDKLSVFGPALTNRISLILAEHQKSHPDFTWQRKLMPGGTCEATTFSTYGYQSTCLCLPLGNYHNMIDIDGVQAGRRPARMGTEFISIADYHGLVQMLVITATQLDSADVPTLKARMESLFKAHGNVLDESAAN